MGGLPASEAIAALIAQLPGTQVDCGPWRPGTSSSPGKVRDMRGQKTRDFDESRRP
jgi:hypothetical protein